MGIVQFVELLKVEFTFQAGVIVIIFLQLFWIWGGGDGGKISKTKDPS